MTTTHALDFDLSEKEENIRSFLHTFAANAMRPASIIADANEHQRPMAAIEALHQLQSGGVGYRSGSAVDGTGDGSASAKALVSIIRAEELSWGAASILLSRPGPGLGGAAIQASGTPAQKEKWLKRYEDGTVRFGAMALTESNAGSDVSAIETTAELRGDHWVLNGSKIFATNGACADVVVVWATIDKSKGKDGIRAFIVEKGTPGFTIGRLEHKMGIRASETAELVFADCKIPKENLLGEENPSAEKKGFKGAMATFDLTRPGVAAMAVGIARAALEYTVSVLEAETDGWHAGYGRSRAHLTALQDAVQEMDAQIEAARLLARRAAFLLDQKQSNGLEASMAKAKAGRVVVDVCAKCVELLGPAALTRAHPLEMWLRDSKVFDIFEGTGQVQRLVVARRILGYTSKELA
ncbi:MAG: acyl-CoA dehydrogenase family protein [Deltaproteobacteria bacterium]|nr:acyl-CoA dehydrogenase family protein [Deltaproteobacteria bacterium]